MGDLRYADAGVDIDEGDRAVRLIKQAVSATHGPEVLGGIGAFSGLFAFDPLRWKRPVLAASTDSVGTKVKVAIATGRHRGIGIDLVNHCVNDILCSGAEPLLFLDYYATGRLSPEHLAEVVDGAAAACAARGVRPGRRGDRRAARPLRARRLRHRRFHRRLRRARRDHRRPPHRGRRRVLGLPSSGLHTNGYSLVRHILAEREIGWDAVLPGTGAPLVDLLLEPHRSYLPAIRELRSRMEIRGLAHITGGGLLGNVPRILPDGTAARIDRTPGRCRPVLRAGGGGRRPGRGDVADLQHGDRHGGGRPRRRRRAAGAAAAGLPVIRLGEIVEREVTPTA